MSKKYPNNKNVFSKTCPKCGKEVSSLVESQFDYNYKQHTDAHERKENKEEQDGA